MKLLPFDVMLADRYVCTLRYPYCPLWPIEINDVAAFVEKKRPTLRGKPYRIAF